MRAWVLGIVLLIACEKSGSSSDCDVVRKDPGNAAATLAKRHPGQAVKVAEIIERCVAPDGAPCERLAKIVAAIPNLMPPGSPAVAAPGDVATACAAMPPEMQRCMFPSYTLANADACAKVYEALASSVSQAGVGQSNGAGSSAKPPCKTLRIEVARDHVTVRRDAERSIPHTGGKVDFEALRTALAEQGSQCVGQVTVSAANDLSYEDVIGAMDAALAAGFKDIAMDTPDTADTPDAADTADTADTADAADTAGGKPADDAHPAAAPGAGSGSRDLSSAPVIAVTKRSISVNRKEVAPLTADATEPVATELAKVRAANPKLQPVVIIQADASTPMRTINQVIAGARRGGFDDVLFAVKQK